MNPPKAPPAAGTLPASDLEDLLAGLHADPFGVLGPHETAGGVAVRAFLPGAAEAWVVEPGGSVPMALVHADGLFEAVLPGRRLPFRDYQLRAKSALGAEWQLRDPYCFPPGLSEFDLHLLGEGRHYRNFERLGAHVREIEGVKGVSFAVWAPNARRVSVVGDFCHWDGRRLPMRKHPGAGVWDLFVPGLGPGAHYKFEIVGPAGELLPLRSDPYGFRQEVRPQTASIVCELDGFAWQDADWLARRAARQAPDQPHLVYEVHLASWMRDPKRPERLFSYRELAERLIPYVLDLGFTHLQLMPVAEHPFDGSWGYQVLGYFAPTSRFGEPQDFMAFVDACHRAGLGVLVDWVPAHFPRDDHGLRRFDGTAIYEHADARQGEHPEWGTLIFNYGRNEVANFLIGNALFWIEKYHIDGLRVDAVASMLYLDYGRKGGEWIPNEYGGNHNLVAAEFLKRWNALVHDQHPGVLTIAEESTAWAGVSRPVHEGGLGFSLKWNMGWMNDTLQYLHRDPVHRQHHQNDLSFSLVYAFSENFVLPLSHDEVVHGKGSLLDKMPGDSWRKFANLRLLLGYMFAHPGKKLLFMGGEFGQWQEWRYWQSLDWHLANLPEHEGVQRWVRDLCRAVRREPALHQLDFSPEGFEWIDHADHQASVMSFLRKPKHGPPLLVVCHFTPETRAGYRVGVPRPGRYEEILNSDAESYGGSGAGNLGGKFAEPLAAHGRPQSLALTLPPLSVSVFRCPS